MKLFRITCILDEVNQMSLFMWLLGPEYAPKITVFSFLSYHMVPYWDALNQQCQFASDYLEVLF